MDQKRDVKAASMEEDLPPPPRREAAPTEVSTAKADKDKRKGRDKAAAEPMSVDKEPPAKVRVQQVTLYLLYRSSMHHSLGMWRCCISSPCSLHVSAGSCIEVACRLLQVQANGHAEPQTTRLHVGHLTRNVNEGHIKEIFSTFGTLKSVEISIDKVQGYLGVKQCRTVK